MKRYIFVISAILALSHAAYAQERVSIVLERQPAEELFRAIEEQTSYRVFCLPQYADTLTVTVTANAEEPVALLRRAVAAASLYVAQYRDELFVTPFAALVTSLPDGYFNRYGAADVTVSAPTVFETPRADAETMRQYDLNEITIYSARLQENVRRATLGVERLEGRAIKNIPAVFGERDILRVVTSLPGVKTVGEASSGFNVRGGATDQNLILFNGGTLYNPSHLFGLFSSINPEVVRDMELYKSSIPARLGGRISSALEINGREGDSEKVKGSASLGLLTSQLTLEGPLAKGKTTFLAAGRATYSDWILKQLPEKSGYRDGNAGFYDTNLTISHRFSESDNITANGYFSHDRFNFRAAEHYAYRMGNASLRWRHSFNPELVGTFSGGYDHYDYTTKNSMLPLNAYSLSFGINQYYLRADMTRYADRHTIDFGVSGLLYALNPGHYAPVGAESLVRDDRMQRAQAAEYAIYAGDRWDLTDRLQFNLGLRYTVYQALGASTYNLYDRSALPSAATVTEIRTAGAWEAFKTYHGPEFRLSARYELADNLSLKAGYNTMRQNIHKLSNTTIMAPADTWKLSDANIRPQTGAQMAAGLYKNFPDVFVETSVEAYYKTMDDYLDYRSGAELLMNHNIETDVLNVEGKAYGVELMIRKMTGKLNGWVSYSWSRTKLRQHDALIAHPVNDGRWYPADYDKPHDIKVVGNYKVTQRFSVSVNADYSTGRPITLPVSKYSYAGGEFVYLSERNSYRIPDFFRMDISLNLEPSHHLTLSTHSSVSIGVYNVTGRKNAYSVYYISEDGHLKGYRMAVFGVPVPYLAYNIKF
ncbi:MAG: TonB-dependent receptor [Tannerella sp.]|jgi:outer membrane receptor protein involved in Fe transport|nr:TonB-dependent receptor [Tannerella sp.]